MNKRNNVTARYRHGAYQASIKAIDDFLWEFGVGGKHNHRTMETLAANGVFSDPVAREKLGMAVGGLNTIAQVLEDVCGIGINGWDGTEFTSAYDQSYVPEGQGDIMGRNINEEGMKTNE